MPRITPEDARGWLEDSKLDLIAIDMNLLVQIETEVLARLDTVYDISTWVDESTTPLLIRAIIAKKYVVWLYQKTYSENQDSNIYARMLDGNAELLINGLISGSVQIPGIASTASQRAVFYPNDASSAQQPTFDDPSLGPAKFSMGRVF